MAKHLKPSRWRFQHTQRGMLDMERSRDHLSSLWPYHATFSSGGVYMLCRNTTDFSNGPQNTGILEWRPHFVAPQCFCDIFRNILASIFTSTQTWTAVTIFLVLHRPILMIFFWFMCPVYVQSYREARNWFFELQDLLLVLPVISFDFRLLQLKEN